MTGSAYELSGVTIFECDAMGQTLSTVGDAISVLEAAIEHEAGLIVLPVGRLDSRFFDLKTRIAGEMLQTFVKYHRRVAIIGNFEGFAANSAALRDFIRESNRGGTIWFLASVSELGERLAGKV
jgi:hypothetical protein